MLWASVATVGGLFCSDKKKGEHVYKYALVIEGGMNLLRFLLCMSLVSVLFCCSDKKKGECVYMSSVPPRAIPAWEREASNL